MTIIVIIKTDPFSSPRGVEAIRMALGLGSGNNRVEIILLGKAPFLIWEATDELKDVETLEKYLPQLDDPGHPFYLTESFRADNPEFRPTVATRELSPGLIAQKIASGDRFLIF